MLRSTTHLVQVNVIALDKNGNPVSDLTAGEFSLTDDGKPQKISIFSLEKSDLAAPPSHPLPPNTFSNRWENHPGTPGSVTVILLDGVNTELSDQAYARQQVRQFLKEMRPQDRVAIYALGKNHLKVVHDFSNDAPSLAQSVEAYQGSIPFALDAQGEDAAAVTAGRSRLSLQAQEEALGRQTDFFILRRAAETVDAIAGIANYLARLPGRKNLIWVSGGFPFSLAGDSLLSPNRFFHDSIAISAGPDRFPHGSTTISAGLARLARALNNANLAIYPVDARGLIGLPAFNASQETFRPDQDTAGLPEIQTMQEIAERTGGRAYYNTNGIREAIRQATDDARVTYLLGYYPTSIKWDGKFHKIKLEVKRPGVDVRYRRGYFALPEATPSPEERQASLEAAVWSPLDSNGLRLLARATPLNRDGKRSLELEIQLDPHDLSLQPESGRWKGALRVLLVQLSVDGHNLRGFSQTYALNLGRESYQRVLKDGFVMRNSQELVPGAEQIRLVVRDESSEAMGSVSIPLARPFNRP